MVEFHHLSCCWVTAANRSGAPVDLFESHADSKMSRSPTTSPPFSPCPPTSHLQAVWLRGCGMGCPVLTSAAMKTAPVYFSSLVLWLESAVFVSSRCRRTPVHCLPEAVPLVTVLQQENNDVWVAVSLNGEFFFLFFNRNSPPYLLKPNLATTADLGRCQAIVQGRCLGACVHQGKKTASIFCSSRVNKSFLVLLNYRSVPQNKNLCQCARMWCCVGFGMNWSHWIWTLETSRWKNARCAQLRDYPVFSSYLPQHADPLLIAV